MRSAAVCSSPNPTGLNTARTAPPEFTGGRKQKVTVDRAENEKDLAQIREELTEQGYLKVQKGKKPRQTTLPPLEFESVSYTHLDVYKRQV